MNLSIPNTLHHKISVYILHTVLVTSSVGLQGEFDPQRIHANKIAIVCCEEQQPYNVIQAKIAPSGKLIQYLVLVFVCSFWFLFPSFLKESL